MRHPGYTTPPGGPEDLYGAGLADRGECARCGHDGDEHGVDGCEHGWPAGAATRVAVGLPRPLRGCPCRGFIAGGEAA